MRDCATCAYTLVDLLLHRQDNIATVTRRDGDAVVTRY